MVVRSTVEDRDDGPWAVVAVEDAGVGFGEDEAARLFEAFYTTKPGGLGMGLSISRSIIDSHRGRLWATANPEHGATFHLALPGMMSAQSPLRPEDARRTVIAQGPSGCAGGGGPLI